MKILLSAYACEPNKGSEPGVGWYWAIEMAQLGHDVWVLTRENNRTNIEESVVRKKGLRNLHFLYYDLPAWARWWKKGGRGVRTYYFLWQWGAYKLAKDIHHSESFDMVHHITFGVVRQPSFMGGLGIPFIFGPVGGGETAPWRLRRGYGLKGLVLDALRDAINAFVKIDPFMLYTFSTANKIYVKTPETHNIIPKKFWPKVQVQLEIGIEESQGVDDIPLTSHGTEIFRVLYVGRFIYWKGMHLGLKAFASLLERVPNASLTMVGKGKDEIRWRRLAKKLGVDDRIEWISWMPQKELSQLYFQHDVFLFPSLHDSSGNVVLEALAHGLPVVCLDLGGPGVIVNETCGKIIETESMSQAKVSQALSHALVILALEKQLYSESLEHGALRRSKEHGWSKIVANIYK